jgi:hypothetical protein
MAGGVTARSPSIGGRRRMPILFELGTAPGETIELVAVFITFVGTLAILAALGHWWQR